MELVRGKLSKHTDQVGLWLLYDVHARDVVMDMIDMGMWLFLNIEDKILIVSRNKNLYVFSLSRIYFIVLFYKLEKMWIILMLILLLNNDKISSFKLFHISGLCVLCLVLLYSFQVSHTIQISSGLLSFVWEYENARVSIINCNVKYAYEYLGNSPTTCHYSSNWQMLQNIGMCLD